MRIEAINLMVPLCDRKETSKCNGSRPASRTDPLVKQESLELDPQLDCGLDDFPLLLDATQCPDCIGDDRIPP